MQPYHIRRAVRNHARHITRMEVPAKVWGEALQYAVDEMAIEPSRIVRVEAIHHDPRLEFCLIDVEPDHLSDYDFENNIPWWKAISPEAAWYEKRYIKPRRIELGYRAENERGDWIQVLRLFFWFGFDEQTGTLLFFKQPGSENED